MMLGMLFELIADLKRYKADKKQNEYLVERMFLSTDKKVEHKMERSDEIKVGDIMKLQNNKIIPADVLVLSSGDENGMCYISTETLDGEQNLKPKLAPTLTQGKIEDITAKGETFDISCIDPNKSIYTFSG